MTTSQIKSRHTEDFDPQEECMGATPEPQLILAMLFLLVMAGIIGIFIVYKLII